MPATVTHPVPGGVSQSASLKWIMITYSSIRGGQLCYPEAPPRGVKATATASFRLQGPDRGRRDESRPLDDHRQHPMERVVWTASGIAKRNSSDQRKSQSGHAGESHNRLGLPLLPQLGDPRCLLGLPLTTTAIATDPS